jgi:hypothetical protein
MITELTTTTTVADDKAIAETRAAMRENFRAVVRWRALYSRKRGLMNRLGLGGAGDRLHWRLKEYEWAAIDAHQAAERRLLELLFLNGERLTASRRL